MDTLSVAEVAKSLGTSTPRVQRAIGRLGISGDGRRRPRYTVEQAQTLRRELGAFTPIDGFTATEVKVLAALAKAPRGLSSARVLAARAGLSPTAASKAFTKLESRRLVLREPIMLAAGTARPVEVLKANKDSKQWPALVLALATTRPPLKALARASRVPPHLRHLFWNTAPSQMSTGSAGGYIARRLITEGDIEGLGWGAANLSREDWLHAAQTRGLDRRQKAMALNFAQQGKKSRAAGTLNGLFSQTKVQFLHCDETEAQALLEPPTLIAGVHVAGIPDIFAMKLKVIADRGELRDYFDLMVIEQQTALTVAEGIGFFLTRYKRNPDNQVLMPVISALGYLDDVDEDDSLPVSKSTIDAYWRKRQPEVARHLQRFGV